MQNFNPLTRRPVFNMDGVSRESRDYGMTADTVAGEAGPIDTSPASEFIARMRAERQNKPKPWQRRNPLIAKPIRYNDPKGGYQQPGTRDGAGVSTAYPPGDIRNNKGPNTHQMMSSHMSSLFDAAAASPAPKPMASFGSSANESTQGRQAAFDSMQAQSAQTQSRRPNDSIRYSQRNPLMR